MMRWNSLWPLACIDPEGEGMADGGTPSRIATLRRTGVVQGMSGEAAR